MPSNQAGKGPQPRAYDTAASISGHERIFGKKKPWWEIRDEAVAASEDVVPESFSAALAEAGYPKTRDIGEVLAEEAENIQPHKYDFGMPRTLKETTELLDEMKGELAADRLERQKQLVDEKLSFTPYQVPVIEVDGPNFGNYLNVPLPPEDGLVIVLARSFSRGWHTAYEYGNTLLPHQVYADDLRPAIAYAKEIVVVGLNTGTWVTVWASAPGEITHPHQANG